MTTTAPVYDRKDQFEQIQSGLMEGEQIIAVYDAVGAGTGFIGLTDRRVIIQDKSFVGKRFAITSIPYSKVTSVSVVSNKSWAGQFFSTGAIAIRRHAHPRGRVPRRQEDPPRPQRDPALHHPVGRGAGQSAVASLSSCSSCSVSGRAEGSPHCSYWNVLPTTAST